MAMATVHVFKNGTNLRRTGLLESNNIIGTVDKGDYEAQHQCVGDRVTEGSVTNVWWVKIKAGASRGGCRRSGSRPATTTSRSPASRPRTSSGRDPRRGDDPAGVTGVRVGRSGPPAPGRRLLGDRPGRVAGEPVGQVDRQHRDHHQHHGGHVDDRGLVGPEQVLEDPQRQRLQARARR